MEKDAKMPHREAPRETTVGHDNPFDVVVVGAGPAGLSAALVLGRMRRRVLLVDTDAPAHAIADGVHGFLGQDGTPPMQLRATAREQLKPYPSVELRPLGACLVHRMDDGSLEIVLDDGTRERTARLLLAHGMRYDLPDLAGAQDLWGSRVFHCPYCHGWEVRDQRVAVHGCTERAVHQALLLSSLTEDVVVFCEHADAFSPEQADHLAALGIDIEARPVRRLEEHEGEVRVILEDGSAVGRDAVFVQPELTLATDLAASLGAELTDRGTVATDETGLSTISGVYVAGDATTPVQSVAVAAATGARAAYAINADLATPRTHPAPPTADRPRAVRTTSTDASGHRSR
jgi:thioredoxin reductase